MHCRRNTATLESRIQRARKWRGRQLDLRGLYLRSCPAPVFQPGLAGHLTALDLSYNDLEALPGCIGSLARLGELVLRHNRLPSLPCELFTSLLHLKSLDVSHNRLAALPPQPRGLVALERLNLSGNRLELVDRNLFSLPRLVKVFLVRNPLTNIPRHVYLEGLQAIRMYFGIQMDRDSDTARSEADVEEQHERSFVEEFQSMTLNKVTTRVSDGSRFECCLKSDGRDLHLATSDYSSLYGDSNDSGACLQQDINSCHGDYGSEITHIQTLEDPDLADFCEVCHQRLDGAGDQWDVEGYEERRLADRTRLLRHNQVAVIIPQHNRSGYQASHFSLHLVNDLSYALAHQMTISPTIALEPHGAQFYADEPALIHIPLRVRPRSEVEVVVLCSQTALGQCPRWQPLVPRRDYSYHGNYVVIRAAHFSLYTVASDTYYPEASSLISPGRGGEVRVPEVPGVKVEFPPGSVSREVQATVQVFYGDSPYDLDPVNRPPRGLATPVVMVTPHGLAFNPDAPPVTVHLPLPDYGAIQQAFGHQAELSLWHSDSGPGQPLDWRPFQAPHQLTRDGQGDWHLEFPVSSFCWYRALLGAVSSALHSARLGVQHYFGTLRFDMMCQALMQEAPGGHAFALEVFCYHSDHKLAQLGNYSHKVCESNKPKPVKPGEIVVRLVSDIFEADTEHGEGALLQKSEPNFCGRDFDLQFACKFKTQPIQKGVFGKLFVEWRSADGSIEPIFDLNLTKKGDENEDVMAADDPWLVSAIKELASVLDISEEDNWKALALELGFTSHEVANKLSYAADPLLKMVQLYQGRGGSPQEFVSSLYQTSRHLRLGETDGCRWGQTPPTWTRLLSPGRLASGPTHDGARTNGRKRCSHCQAEGVVGGKRRRNSPATESSGSDSGGSSSQTPSPSKPAPQPHRSSAAVAATQPSSHPQPTVASTPAPLAAADRPLPPHQSSPAHLPQAASQATPPAGNLPLGVAGHPSPATSTTTLVPAVARPAPASHSHLSQTLSSLVPSTPHQLQASPLPPLPPSRSLQLGVIGQGSEGQRSLSDRDLWNISKDVRHSWKEVGRSLGLEEYDIEDIESANRGKTREQAYKMLLLWKEQFPDRCVVAGLYRALCEARLDSVAVRCCNFY